MKIIIDRPADTPRNLIRRCGYAEFTDPRTRETSYVRRLEAGNFYPRFHVYVEEAAEQMIINLHLDQKKPSYEGFSAHSGEYDGEVVEREGERIREYVTNY